MKQKTKRFLGIAAASALVIGVTTGVFARGGFGPGWGGHHGMMGGPGGMHGPGAMMGGDPVTYADRYLNQVKTRLGITSDQETAWNGYEDAVKGKAGLMLAHRQIMFGAGQIGPDQRFAFHQQGLEQMQELTKATRGLFDVLTPEQQARAGNLMGLHQALR